MEIDLRACQLAPRFIAGTVASYTRGFVAPRPERVGYASASAYETARNSWKADYPNLHTAEEERAHVLDMMERRARKGGAK